MHLFYNDSQIIRKNGYLGRLICHIFGIFTVNFGLGQSKWHGFPNLLGPFHGPNRFVALLPQSDKTSQNHNEYRMLSSQELFLSNFTSHLSGSRKLWWPSSYSQSNLFARFLPRLIRPPGNISSKLSLVSTWHITNGQNDIFITK